MFLRQFYIAQNVDQESQRQLGWPRSAITPFESSRAVIAHVQMQGERPPRFLMNTCFAQSVSADFFGPYFTRPIRIALPPIRATPCQRGRNLLKLECPRRRLFAIQLVHLMTPGNRVKNVKHAVP